ncbi:hypothetical protein D3C72_1636280 [compost metagenome]
MAGRAQRLPGQVAQSQHVAGRDGGVKAEARALLARGLETQGVDIPGAHLVRFRHGNGRMAAVLLLQQRVAAAMVGMQMGVEQAVQRTAGKAMAQQGQGLRCMRDIAAVDQGRVLPAQEQDVVRRQPAAFEHLHGIGEQRWRSRHGFLSSRARNRAGIRVLAIRPTRRA